MVAPLEDVEALFSAVKNLRDERRKMEKLSDKAFCADGHKAIQKSSVDLNWQAFHVNKIEHEVHALAVDCGVADARSAGHYEPYSVKLTGFHEYQVCPRKPRGLAEGRS
ncbi:hypothetical protein [Mesorhizobium amorphae]|uniref:hypothetical protein n=1 Tax=Mesorhizobium amorphae TaxID=71433 RepID=UPI00118499EF|nr:hypothetical protein [Mesorhizobium amorphae]